MQQTVKVPPELQNVKSSLLEEYVRQRIYQGLYFFRQRLEQNRLISEDAREQSILQCMNEAMHLLPSPDYGGLSLQNRELQLVFRHDCLALGCLDPACILCQHNPNRRCKVNFDRKYLVGDVLKAKCSAPIRVEVIDRATGLPVDYDIPDVQLQVYILDGNQYDNKCLDTGSESIEDVDQCALLNNNKQMPLLVSTMAQLNDQSGKIIISLMKGRAQLPELHVTDSSEALLSGRRPPFRLLVRAVHMNQKPLNIRHAVSEGFVVATRRTRTAGKADIPTVDDHVSKLEHMGKETVKKLAEIHNVAVGAGLDLQLSTDLYNIQKVGQFKKLAERADQDGHLRQKLQQILKLSKEKWEEARDHAARAVRPDFRMRAWYQGQDQQYGIIFTCHGGQIDLERPVGLLEKKSENGEEHIEATMGNHLNALQMQKVKELHALAMSNWWVHTHAGWAIFPADSEHFSNTGKLKTTPGFGPLPIVVSSNNNNGSNMELDMVDGLHHRQVFRFPVSELGVMDTNQVTLPGSLPPMAMAPQLLPPIGPQGSLSLPIGNFQVIAPPLQMPDLLGDVSMNMGHQMMHEKPVQPIPMGPPPMAVGMGVASGVGVGVESSNGADPQATSSGFVGMCEPMVINSNAENEVNGFTQMSQEGTVAPNPTPIVVPPVATSEALGQQQSPFSVATSMSLSFEDPNVLKSLPEKFSASFSGLKGNFNGKESSFNAKESDFSALLKMNSGVKEVDKSTTLKSLDIRGFSLEENVEFSQPPSSAPQTQTETQSEINLKKEDDAS